MSLGKNELRQLTPVINATAPGVNQDASQGYMVGSVVWSIADAAYFYCTDTTTGSAVWVSFATDEIKYAVAAGTDNYTVTFTPPVSPHVAGSAFLIKFTNANTGASTIDFNGIGPVPLRKNGATALAAGDISAAQTLLLVYDAAGYYECIGVAASSGSGTVNSGTQYRLGYYATTGSAISEAGLITGARALISDANGVPTHSPTTAAQLAYLQGISAPAIGDLLYFDGTNFVKLAAGAVGQPLLGNGAAAPVWGTAPSGVVDYSASDSLVGFSATTTHIFLYSYNPATKMCVCSVSFSGTSDSVDLTTSLPFTSAAEQQLFMAGGVTNNGATSLNNGRVAIAAGSTTAVYTRDRNSTAWTASGSKVWFGSFTYLTA